MIRSRRIERERTTLGIMIDLFCKEHHDPENGLCSLCSELWDYAQLRLDKCKFQAMKPQCSQCRVHCYKSEMKEKVKSVMRYSGPRMLWHHPILAILHVIDGFKHNKS